MRIERAYDVHGVPVRVRSDRPVVARILDSRLLRFRVRDADPGRLGVTITVHGPRATVPDVHAGRTVLESGAWKTVYDDARDVLSSRHPDGVNVRCLPGSGTLDLYVASDGEAGDWIASRLALGFPFHEILKRRGMFFVHAAAFEQDGACVLASGPSGCGKTTLTAAMLRAGAAFLGDDASYLSVAEGLRVLAFPDEIDLTDHTAAMFPELARRAVRASPLAAKRAVAPDDVPGLRYVEAARPGVLVLVGRRDGRASQIVPVDPGEALLALTPNVLLTEPRASQAHLDALAALTRQSACVRLRMGSDLERLPELLARVGADGGRGRVVGQAHPAVELTVAEHR